MADYVTRIKTTEGEKQIDYTALANLPQSDTKLTTKGAFADAQIVGTKVTNLQSQITAAVGQITSLAEEVHSADNITYGTLNANRLPLVPIKKGGTGAETGSDGLKNLLTDGAMVLSEFQYGDALPTTDLVAGRIFFVKVQ